MRFNRLGVAGLGRTARWLNEELHVDNRGSDADGWHLADQFGRIIAPGGVAYLAAGGGRWADTTGAVRSNFGYDNARGKVWDLAHDGTVVETPDYQAGHQVGIWGGPYVSGAVQDARAIGDGQFVAIVGGRVQSSTLGTVALPPGVTPFAVMQVANIVLVATHSHLVLVAPSLAYQGRVFGTYLAAAPAFYPDLTAVAGGVRAGWTDTPADTGLHVRDVPFGVIGDDLTELADFYPWPRPIPTPSPAPTPAPSPQPPPQPEPTPVTYVRRSPDLTARVAEVARQFPVEWEAARKQPSGHRDDRFIRRLAWELHRHVDGRIGLNGKRGTDTISTDALAYRNDSGPGGVEVIDVITGRHEPAWQDVTIPVGHPEHPDGVLGKFIQPTDPGGVSSGDGEPGGGSTTGTTITVDLTAVLTPIRDELASLRQQLEAQAAEIRQLKDAIDRLGQATSGVTLPTRIALKTDFGDYLTAEAGGDVTHRETTPASWQTFRFEVVE